jgi:hypothetical protein
MHLPLPTPRLRQWSSDKHRLYLTPAEAEEKDASELLDSVFRNVSAAPSISRGAEDVLPLPVVAGRPGLGGTLSIL